MKWTWRDTIAIAAITFVVSAFFFRLFWPVPQLIVTPDFGRSDAWSFSFTSKYILAQNLKQGVLPLWSRQLGDGFPVLAEGQIGTFFLPNLILFRLFDVVTAYNLALTLTIATLGVGMYLWLRVQNLSRVVSLFIAISFAGSGIVIPHLTHIALLQGFTLLPAIMAITYMWAKKRTWLWALLFSLTASQQLLAGFVQASFITLLFAAAYYLFLIRHEKKKWPLICQCAVAGIGMAILSAIQLFPSMEFLKNISAGQGFLPLNASYYSFPFADILTLIHPFIFGSARDGSHMINNHYAGNIFWENNAFIGTLPLVLFAVSLFIKKRRADGNRFWFFLITAAVALLLMAGRWSPIYLLYSFWPFNLFRVPARFIWIFAAAILLVAAYAADKILQSARSRLLTVLITSVLFLLNIYQIGSLWWNYHLIEPASVWLTRPQLATSLTPDNRVATILQVAIYSEEFNKFGWLHPDFYHLMRNTIDPNGNVIWNIQHHDIAAGRLLKRPGIADSLIYADIKFDDNTHIATVSAFAQKLFTVMGIDSIISPAVLENTSFMPIASVSANTQTLTLYHNPQAVPHAYLATHIALATTVEEVSKRLADDAFIPGKTVLLESTVSARLTGEGTVTMTKQTDREELLEVDATGSHILVDNDTYYPGWHAYVDGVETPIFPANIRYRAIIVPEGHHVVRFIYTPTMFVFGAWVSGISYVVFIAGACLLSFSERRNESKVQPRASRRRRNHDR